MKKVTSLLLAVLMVCSVLPFAAISVSAEATVTQTVTKYYCLDVGAGAYIDTEYTPKSNTRVVMVAEVNNKEAALFGTHYWADNKYYMFHVNSGGGNGFDRSNGLDGNKGSGGNGGKMGEVGEMYTGCADGQNGSTLDNSCQIFGSTALKAGKAAVTAKATVAYGGEEYFSVHHHNWQYVDAMTHTCTICKETAAHTEKANSICLLCNSDMAIVVPEDAATCNKTGTLAYYKFKGKYYRDPACTQEITDLNHWLKTDGSTPKLDHIGQWCETTKHTNAEDGIESLICTLCGETLETRPCGHTYSAEWSYNEDAHWHATTCGHTDSALRKDKANHTADETGHCTVCGYYCGISSSGSVLSQGNIWIIVAVAVGVLGGVTALVIMKKKKKPAQK